MVRALQGLTTPLFHYKARVYHPRLGRFLQTDPVGYKDDQDLYTYVGNDPYSKADPSGKIAFLIPAAVAAWRIYNAIDTVETVVGSVTVLASATATNGEKLAAGVELAGSMLGGRSGRQAAGGAVRAVEGGAAKGGTYVLKNPDGTVVKTGRTNDLARREGEHGRGHPDKTFEVDKRTDNRAAQRGREQDLHDANPSAHADNGGLDKINGIRPNNPRRDEYLREGRKLP